jgi:putative hemolysin
MMQRNKTGYFREKTVLVCALIGIALVCQAGSALMNPAAVYCSALGYAYDVKTSDAGQTGFCVLPGNQPVDAWQFLKGTTGQQYTYCARQGYQVKTITDPKQCFSISSGSCAVCLIPDGREVEVTRYMNLDFREPNLTFQPIDDGGTSGGALFPATPITIAIGAGLVICVIAGTVVLLRKK